MKTLLAVIDEVIQDNSDTYFSTVAFWRAQKGIRASETPVFQWLHQKVVSSKEEDVVSSNDVKEAKETKNKIVDTTNLVDVLASRSKEKKKEITDILNINEDVNPPLSECQAAREKFTDVSFLNKFLKVYEWDVQIIRCLKKDTPAIANKK